MPSYIIPEKEKIVIGFDDEKNWPKYMEVEERQTLNTRMIHGKEITKKRKEFMC